MKITGEIVKKMCDEIDELTSLIPDNLKEAHKDAIIYGQGCFIVDENGITPIGQGDDRQIYRFGEMTTESGELK